MCTGARGLVYGASADPLYTYQRQQQQQQLEFISVILDMFTQPLARES